VHGEDVISYSGSTIGVCSLRTPPGGQHSQLALTQPLTLQGTRDASNIVALGLLRFSRLLVLATEDGYVKVCC